MISDLTPDAKTFTRFAAPPGLKILNAGANLTRSCPAIISPGRFETP
jgi:hypothetical protein